MIEKGIKLQETIFKKAKNNYLYELSGNKYFDLRNNSNIIGFGDKNYTNYIKDHISSKWISKGNTVYHKRFKKLITELFSEEYEIFTPLSLKEFFYELITSLSDDNYSFEINGDRFRKWFSENIFIKNKNKNNSLIKFYDMTEIYLTGNIDFQQVITTDPSLKVLNYFWYPEIEVKTYNADIIILPELFSGNFLFANILINKKSVFYKNALLTLNLPVNIPSLYLASVLKFYHLIKKTNDSGKIFELKWKKLIQKNRLLTFNMLDKKSIDDLFSAYYDKKIILNNKAPYYSYIPLILEDYQKKNLKGLKI